MSFKSYEGRYYIESKNIRVFPCAYRGYYNTAGEETTTKVFDPEARATTEANFANTYHKISVRKESYVVSWDSENSVLKVVIGGYYFEITGHTINDFFDEDNPKSLCIKTEEITLGTDEADDERKTTILKSWTENDKYLDVADSSGTSYIFTGLIVVNDLEDADVENANNILTPFILKDNIKIVNPVAYAVGYILDTDEGKNSIRLVDDNIDGTDMSTKATGDYAVALGRHTEAIGNYALAFGNETQAKSAGSIALGNHVTADKENQVVIGKYNQVDTDQAFIIANGTESSGSNIFTVSDQGDTAISGDLDVSGYTTLDGSLTVSQATTLEDDLAVNGDIDAWGNSTIGGTFGVSGNASIGGTLNVTGASTMSSSLTVANNIRSNTGISVYKNSSKVFEVKDTGSVVATGKIKSAKTVSTDDEDILVTKSYIDNLLNISKADLEEQIAAAQAAAQAAAKTELENQFSKTATTNTTKAGEYVAGVKQNNGVIETTSKPFASDVTADGDTAPTSAAVYHAINNLWVNTDSWKTAILEAAYPVGSIYTCYSIKSDLSCPIESTLGGYWDRIDPGTFLCAAGTGCNPGSKGGSADATLVNHTHEYTKIKKLEIHPKEKNFDLNGTECTTRDIDGKEVWIMTTGEGGTHKHDITIKTMAAGSGAKTGIEAASGDKADGSIWHFTTTTPLDAIKGTSAPNHSHSFMLPELEQVGEDGTDKNLPPYLAVYMWIRTA